MSQFENLRKFAAGKISADTLYESMQPFDDDISEYEADEKFMQECAADGLGVIIQSMMLGEYGDKLDENTQSAINTVKDYLIGQGVLTEASTVKITNPKINVVHLSKQAQIKRLTTIITLKMARKADHKCYKKYKVGQRIKKENMESMRKLFGAKAERLAKKLWAKNQKSGKVNAVVDTAKKK